MIKRRKILCILVLVLVMIGEQIALAQDYIVSQGVQIKVNIAAKGVNRIAIENDRIAQVIGNEDEYFVESDPNLGQIFLTSALKASSEITIRFLTEREKIIDAKLVVSQVDPQTIVFKYKGEDGPRLSNLSDSDNLKSSAGTSFISKNTYEYKTSNFDSDDGTNQVINLIKQTHNSKDIKGLEIHTLSCLSSNVNLKGLKFVNGNSFDLKKYQVIKAVIQNNSKYIISLDEQDFSKCMKNINAVALEKESLGPKENTNLYLVGSYGK